MQLLSHNTLISIEKSSLSCLDLMECIFDSDITNRYSFHLKSLCIRYDITNDILFYLCYNGSFESIHLVELKNLTDDVLNNLNIKSLKKININNCNQITDNGIIRLIKKFPLLEIN